MKFPKSKKIIFAVGICLLMLLSFWIGTVYALSYMDNLLKAEKALVDAGRAIWQVQSINDFKYRKAYDAVQSALAEVRIGITYLSNNPSANR